MFSYMINKLKFMFNISDEHCMAYTATNTIDSSGGSLSVLNPLKYNFFFSKGTEFQSRFGKKSEGTDQVPI